MAGRGMALLVDLAGMGPCICGEICIDHYILFKKSRLQARSLPAELSCNMGNFHMTRRGGVDDEPLNGSYPTEPPWASGNTPQVGTGLVAAMKVW